MRYTSIFGQDLTEYEVEVLIGNHVVDTQWALAARRLAEWERYHHQRAPAGIARHAFVAAGLIGSAATAAYKTWNHVARRAGTAREGNLRGTSFINLQRYGTNSVEKNTCGKLG